LLLERQWEQQLTQATYVWTIDGGKKKIAFLRDSLERPTPQIRNAFDDIDPQDLCSTLQTPRA
jgi:hypothetical protein